MSDEDRARQLDDRPDTTLAAIARDMDRERHDPAALTVERYGRPPAGEANQPAAPLLDGPREWRRRRAVLTEALDGRLRFLAGRAA